MAKNMYLSCFRDLQEERGMLYRLLIVVGVLSCWSGMAAAHVVVCTNFGQISEERYLKLAKILDVGPPEIALNEMPTQGNISSIRVYLSPFIDRKIISCLYAVSNLFPEVLDSIGRHRSKMEIEEEIYPNGPKGPLIQSSELLQIDGVNITVTVSEMEEPVRSIYAMTSILGLDTTACMRHASCFEKMGKF